MLMMKHRMCLIYWAEKSLYEVSEGNIRKNYDKMSSLIRQALDQIEEVKTKKVV